MKSGTNEGASRPRGTAGLSSGAMSDTTATDLDLHDEPDITDKIVIHEALAVIDKALTDMLQRELVSTGEVADLLLDVRSLLSTSPAAK
ncbi:MAG: hypothetical protein RL283_701 [Actinomycetota bacterium]